MYFLNEKDTIVHFRYKKRNLINLFEKYEYRDQPWFSVFKHSMDHEEGV